MITRWVTRPIGKLSGAADKMLAAAGDYVASFTYRDRLEGIPIHDEQGTYDRPHDLTVNVDPAKIDAALGYPRIEIADDGKTEVLTTGYTLPVALDDGRHDADGGRDGAFHGHGGYRARFLG